MKQLIWKELREQRYISIAYAALLIVAMIGWNIARTAYYPTSNLGNLYTLLFIGFVICSIFTACIAMTYDIEHGTMRFRECLPVDRRRIWISKISSAVINTMISILVMTIAFVVTSAALYNQNQLISLTNDLQLFNAYLGDRFGYVFLLIMFFSLSFYISAFFDRVIVSICISLIISLLFENLSVSLGRMIYFGNPVGHLVTYAAMLYVSISALYISFTGFYRINTTADRNRLSLISTGKWLLIGSIIYITYAVIYFYNFN